MSDHHSGFTRVPLELRNEIYEYLMVDLPSTLQVPTHVNGSGLPYLMRRLPRCLLLNHQVLEEAIMVYLRRTLLSIDNPSLASLEHLLSELPNNNAYKNVRYLEFRRPQNRYAQPYGPKSSTAPADCVHDIVSRCPGLRVLTMAVPKSMLATTVKETEVAQARTMEELEETIGFTRVFEHGNMQRLQLVCNDGAEYARMGISRLSRHFESFTKSFVEEARQRGRNISVYIKICPYNCKGTDLHLRTSGHVTSYYYQDYRGDGDVWY